MSTWISQAITVPFIVTAPNDNADVITVKNSSQTNILSLFSDSSGHGVLRVKNSVGTTKVELWSNGLSYFNNNNGGIVIGATSINAAALLQVDSTTKGFLPPRMTTTQKNAIASPTAGLMVYDTTLNKLCVYTTAWETVTSA